MSLKNWASVKVPGASKIWGLLAQRARWNSNIFRALSEPNLCSKFYQLYDNHENPKKNYYTSKVNFTFSSEMDYSRKKSTPRNGWGRFFNHPLTWISWSTRPPPSCLDFQDKRPPSRLDFCEKNIRLKFNFFWYKICTIMSRRCSFFNF